MNFPDLDKELVFRVFTMISGWFDNGLDMEFDLGLSLGFTGASATIADITASASTQGAAEPTLWQGRRRSWSCYQLSGSLKFFPLALNTASRLRILDCMYETFHVVSFNQFSVIGKY